MILSVNFFITSLKFFVTFSSVDWEFYHHQVRIRPTSFKTPVKGPKVIIGDSSELLHMSNRSYKFYVKEDI